MPEENALAPVQMRDRLFYTVGALGKSRRITPEGFLAIEGVPIARTGIQMYAAQELPSVVANEAGEIRVERLPEEVFHPNTIASFEGKPITVMHPDEFVSPENYKTLTVGTVLNPRRGEGIEDDVLLADLLITSADAIAYANKELPQLSAGYSAEYEQIEAGYAVQRNIVANHVALVERGRAGPRCAIKDQDPTGVDTMTTKTKRTLADRIRSYLKANDTAAVLAELDSEEVGTTPPAAAVAVTVDAADLGKKMDKLIEVVEKALTTDKKSKDGDGDCSECGGKDGKHTKDCSHYSKDDGDLTEAERAPPTQQGTIYTGDQITAIVSRAEILSPGIKVPTSDALGTKDAVPQFMMSALEAISTTDEGKEIVAPFLMGRELKSLTGDALLGVFNGAAELKRIRNNTKGGGAFAAVSTKDFGKPKKVADINKANAEFWSKGAK